MLKVFQQAVLVFDPLHNDQQTCSGGITLYANRHGNFNRPFIKGAFLDLHL